MVEIRPAGVADAGILAELNADIQAIHCVEHPWRFKPPGREQFSRDHVEKLVSNPNVSIVIASVEGRPVAYAYSEFIQEGETAFTYPDSVLYLHHVSVRPAFRRRGVATALMRHVEQRAKERGAKMILDVWTANEQALAFYARLGFSRYRERWWNR